MIFALLDDEKTFTENFGEICRRIRSDTEIKSFDNEESLMEFLKDACGGINGVFIDIRLSDSNGIDIAQKVSAHYPGLPVVFVTGYPQEYCQNIFLEHFDIKPLAFVCKPVEEQVLARVFEKLESTSHANIRKITIHSGRRDHIIRTDDITYLESNRWYVIVHTCDGEYPVRTKLSDIASRLPDEFVVSHKSYLVNADRVSSFDAASVTLDNGITLPVSRSCKDQFKKRMLEIKGFAKC